jgi:hypothetical protein
VLDGHETEAIQSPARDGVTGLETDGVPTIVSISDIHGFLSLAQSALLSLNDHPDYEPVVEVDAAHRLHWSGGEEYVLVFNGDLIDRGPQSKRVVDMVSRLIDEAPPGHVRVTVGNHEMGVLMPELYGWDNWYSGQRSPDERRALCDQIFDGHVVAAYDGYNVTYAHAGQPSPYDAVDVNETLIQGTEAVLDSTDAPDAFECQEQIASDHQRVFGYDGETGRGPNAGLTWLDFEHMPEDAPPQVVGHTQHENLMRRGNVICQNVLRSNRHEDGGEGVIVETPDKIAALGRTADDSVVEYSFSFPALEASA